MYGTSFVAPASGHLRASSQVVIETDQQRHGETKASTAAASSVNVRMEVGLEGAGCVNS